MRLRLFFATILLPVDYAMLVAAAITAYFLRFESELVELRPAISIIPFNWYLFLSLTVPLGWLLIFALNGLYRIEERRFFDDVPKIVFACSTGIMFAIALIFFRREFFASRFVVLAAWILSIVFVLTGRAIVNFIYYLCRRSGLGILRVAIIGGGRTGEALRREYFSNALLGRKVISFFPYFDEMAKTALKNLKIHNNIDEVICASPPNKEVHQEMLRFCEENRINFKYSADSFSSTMRNFKLSTAAGIPIVEIRRTRLDGWGRICKRIFDIVGSALLLILFAPVMLIIALAIKLERRSAGPIFWSRLDDGSRAQRVGEDGKLFNYFKFRSMRPNTHNMRYSALSGQNARAGTSVVKIKNDPRVTNVGMFIRRYSLDELPEFILVLKGDMSIVGPRPHLPEEVEKYSGRHKKNLTIKPGITGLAQISGRADLDFEDEARLDAYYIENWSMWMDLYILLKTPFVVLGKKGAY